MEPKLLIFYDNELNALEIKQRLADAAIECELQKEQKTIINSLSDSIEEGMAVYVDKKDYLEAKNILDTYEQELDQKGLWCPECGSEDVTVSINTVKFKWSRIILTSLGFAVLVSLYLVAIHHIDTLPGVIGGFIGALIGALVGGLIGYNKKGYEKKTYHCNNCGEDFSEEDRI